jgi:hypothetical protein
MSFPSIDSSYRISSASTIYIDTCLLRATTNTERRFICGIEERHQSFPIATSHQSPRCPAIASDLQWSQLLSGGPRGRQPGQAAVSYISQ